MKLVKSKIESDPLFKLFLRRIWFKNYDEYFKLFWDDDEKRDECIKWFLKTYPNYKI